MADNIATTTSAVFLDFDADAQLVKRLPEYFQNWVMFEAPVAVNVQDILDEHRRRMMSSNSFFSGRSEDPDSVWRSVLWDAQQVYLNDARAIYGRDYPVFRASKRWVRLPLDRRRRAVLR